MVASGTVGSRDIRDDAVKSRHIAPNAATGDDVQEGSLNGIGSGVLGGTWTNVTTPFAGQDGGNALSALGYQDEISKFAPILAPTDLKIVDFRVRLANEQVQGTREFRIGGLGFEGVGPVLCKIEAGQQGCNSTKAINIKAGKRFYFYVNYLDDAAPATTAYFGYRAVTP